MQVGLTVGVVGLFCSDVLLFGVSLGHHLTPVVVVGRGRGDTVWQEGLPIYRTKIL